MTMPDASIYGLIDKGTVNVLTYTWNEYSIWVAMIEEIRMLMATEMVPKTM